MKDNATKRSVSVEKQKDFSGQKCIDSQPENCLSEDGWCRTKPRVKPWPNGVASRRKLKTWVYFWLRLARTCVHLRWLAMTCAHFGRGQICTQVKASFSPFGHPSQVNSSWVTSISVSLANEIKEMSALKWVYLRLAFTREEICLSVWPPNGSLYASSTSCYLRLLASPFGRGLKQPFLKQLYNEEPDTVCSCYQNDGGFFGFSECVWRGFRLFCLRFFPCNVPLCSNNYL